MISLKIRSAGTPYLANVSVASWISSIVITGIIFSLLYIYVILYDMGHEKGYSSHRGNSSALKIHFPEIQVFRVIFSLK